MMRMMIIVIMTMMGYTKTLNILCLHPENSFILDFLQKLRTRKLLIFSQKGTPKGCLIFYNSGANQEKNA